MADDEILHLKGYDLAKCAHCGQERGKHDAEHSFSPKKGDEWCDACDDWLVNCDHDEFEDFSDEDDIDVLGDSFEEPCGSCDECGCDIYEGDDWPEEGLCDQCYFLVTRG